MKRQDLKDLIKPLVKECMEESVREIVVESGLLSKVISEVVKGISPVIKEEKQEESRYAEILKRSENKKIDENRKQLLDTVGKSSFSGINVFENVSAMPEEPKPGNPMSGISPNDPGVNLEGLFDFNKAKLLANTKKKRN